MLKVKFQDFQVQEWENLISTCNWLNNRFWLDKYVTIIVAHETAKYVVNIFFYSFSPVSTYERQR